MEKELKTKPVAKFKAGAITATVWENKGTDKKTGQEYTIPSVGLERSYKDQQGEWQKTGALRTNDLPRAILVLGKSFDFLVSKAKETAEE
jgi:hypothetical protein